MATNRQFNDAIQLSTSSIDNVKLRFDIMRQTVEGVLKDHVIQPRCFSRELKQELFDKNPACQICHQQPDRHCRPTHMRPMFPDCLKLFGPLRIADFIGVKVGHAHPASDGLRGRRTHSSVQACGGRP